MLKKSYHFIWKNNDDLKKFFQKLIIICPTLDSITFDLDSMILFCDDKRGDTLKQNTLYIHIYRIEKDPTFIW